MKYSVPFAIVGILSFCTAVVLLVFFAQSATAPKSRFYGETIYIRNTAHRYFPDAQIRKDIPVWEEAANKDFAPIWRTPHVHIVLLAKHQKVPSGGILASFVEKGPIQGALAYHNDKAGVPLIVVYAGTGTYYGYNNSVSFTHELFETLADHFVSGFNIGYPAPFYYVGNQPNPMPRYAPWFNEVCDPVEKYDYKLRGVQISDFITPAWFNDSVGYQGFDWMGLVQEPFQVLKGGYAQYVINGQDTVVENFKHAGPDASGFLAAEGHARS